MRRGLRTACWVPFACGPGDRQTHLEAGAPSHSACHGVTTAVALELQVEAIVLADELLARDQTLTATTQSLFPGASLSSVPHEEFKQMSESAIAIVRTGECTPYYNVVLISGVTY